MSGPARSRSAWGLSALLSSSAVVHFLRPETFTGIVPSWVPGTAEQVVYASGAAELAVGVLVAYPRTRRLGGYAAAGLLVAVFPANIKMALDGGAGGAGGGGFFGSAAFAYARLPVQIPLVLWAWYVAGRLRPGSGTRPAPE